MTEWVAQSHVFKLMFTSFKNIWCQIFYIFLTLIILITKKSNVQYTIRGLGCSTSTGLFLFLCSTKMFLVSLHILQNDYWSLYIWKIGTISTIWLSCCTYSAIPYLPNLWNRISTVTLTNHNRPTQKWKKVSVKGLIDPDLCLNWLFRPYSSSLLNKHIQAS